MINSLEELSARPWSGTPDIAVVIPFFQRQSGLLTRAVRSAFAQTQAARLLLIIADDSSPIAAEDEIRPLVDVDQQRILISRNPNAGAGAARNQALSMVPAGFKYVAFLDSDDAWRPRHIETAVAALELGYNASFSNFIGVGYPDISHFDRIGALKPADHPLLNAERQIHGLSCSALEHTVSDGGGLIGTPTVVYDFQRFGSLRFREEFYNGQDFFFWMDLSELGARFAFSFEVTCDNGSGINIYQASGWGSEKSLQRIRNELFVWTSVERFYRLSPALKRANRRTIRHLQSNVGIDLVHRLRHRKPISGQLLTDICRMSPSTLWRAPLSAVRSVFRQLARIGSENSGKGV